MANKKISELDAIPALDALDVLPIVDNTDATTKKVSVGQFDSRYLTIALLNGKFLVGDATNTAVGVLPTGDVTFNNSGVFAIGTNKVQDSMFRQSAGLSVIGRGSNSTGNVADITASVDGHVLRRSGSTVAFGTVDTAGITNDAVTFAKFQNITSARLLGRTTAGSGDMEEITLGTNLSFAGNVLNATGGGGGIGGSTGSTDNRVLRADGTGGATLQNSGVTIDDNGFLQISVATEQGLEVISTLGAGAGNNLALFQNNNVLWDRPLIRSNDNTSNGGAANARFDSPNPDLEFVETDQVSPAGKFEIAVNADKLQFNGRDSIDSQFEPAATLTRYGKSGAECRFLIGGLYDGANAHLEIVSVNSSDYFMLSTAVGGTSGNVLKVTSTGAFTFNTGAAARNFNLRSVNDSNMFLMDATNDRIGIRQGSPTSSFHIGGSLGLPYVAKTANYTLTATDYEVNCTSGTFTLTLPAAAGITGRIYVCKNSGTGVVTVDANASETIDGALTEVLAQYDCITIMSNGANWIVTARN